MASAGITAIALFTPMIASNAIFSARRASRGIDAMDENPLFGIANMNIAAGQILKGARAAKGIALATNTISEADKGAFEAIKSVSNSNKVLKSVGKVVSLTADYINPFIIGAGVLKVAGADDKLDEAARESTRLTCMFTAEALAKEFVGLPFTQKVNGKEVVRHREGLYKKLFSEKQMKAINEFCATKKYMKHAVGGAKGLLFVGASIAGYKLGDMLSNAILGKKQEKVSNN